MQSELKTPSTKTQLDGFYWVLNFFELNPGFLEKHNLTIEVFMISKLFKNKHCY